MREWIADMWNMGRHVPEMRVHSVVLDSQWRDVEVQLIKDNNQLINVNPDGDGILDQRSLPRTKDEVYASALGCMYITNIPSFGDDITGTNIITLLNQVRSCASLKDFQRKNAIMMTFSSLKEDQKELVVNFLKDVLRAGLPPSIIDKI